MNVKQIIEADIEDSGMNGEGVARVDGKVVFIPYALKGERVRAVVNTVKSKYAEAGVIKVLRASERRTDPECPHYYKCGGCDTCHVDGAYRRELILNELKNNLKKIAGVELTPQKFIESKSNIRNKLAMPFGYRGGKVVLGMYRHNTHDVEPVDCMLAGSMTRSIVRTVCDFANDKKLSVYDGKSDGLLRHLVVREICGRASVTLVTNGAPEKACERELAGMLPDAADFFVCENKKRGNVIMGERARLIKGRPRLEVNVLGVKAELSPLSFFQVNDYIRDKLYKAASALAEAPTLVDLYSGIGITSNLAANKGKRVFAVECVQAAVDDANDTARRNGNADRITNICGLTEDVLPRIAHDISGGCDVLLDPPRKGCGDAVMRAVNELAPSKVIYISCNHATMCRDIKALTDYEINDIAAYDMFCGTHHVETLVCLKRK